jgi:hypothetical protein
MIGKRPRCNAPLHGACGGPCAEIRRRTVFEPFAKEQRAMIAEPGTFPGSSGTKVPERIGKSSDDTGTICRLPYEGERRRERF